MPSRLSDIVAAARTFGVELDEVGGKHPFKLRKDGCRTYPVPAHNGLRSEVPDHYIRAMCRNFGIDVEAFYKAL